VKIGDRGAPIVAAGYFPNGGVDPLRCYERMAAVLAFTLARHCTGWDRRVEAFAPADDCRPRAMADSYVWNTQKMLFWSRLVDEAPDGAELLLLDADIMVLRPLDDLWTRSFDMAYTTKVDARLPFNTGVVALRLSPAVRAFHERWVNEQLKMLRDQAFHATYRHKYGGIHQAALGYCLEQGAAKHLELLELPCTEWNCEDATWRQFSPETTRIVHLKSGLRSARLRSGPVSSASPADGQFVAATRTRGDGRVKRTKSGRPRGRPRALDPKVQVSLRLPTSVAEIYDNAQRAGGIKAVKAMERVVTLHAQTIFRKQ
jgi:hypothetical protein